MIRRRVGPAIAALAGGALLIAACSSGSGGGGTSAATPPGSAGSARATTAASPYANWPAYHGNGYHTGYAATMPHVAGKPTVVHRLKLDGQVYASPLVINGVTIVATENDTVYAFDPSFRVIWNKHLGAPATSAQHPCGNIDPLGITGTPYYDRATGLVFVASEFSGSPPTHQLYALRLSTGATAFHRSIDLPGVDRAVMQQRGALNGYGSRVYVPFGGLAGDCGNYKGRVVGVSTKGTGATISYTVPTAREAGIWTPPGPTIDYKGTILVEVGNGASDTSTSRYDYSDSVLQLNTALHLTGSFSPRTWAADNAADLDLGSQGPTIAGKWVFADGKSGTAYVLRRDHLGGIGGEVSQARVCRSFGGTATIGSAIFVPCTDGIRRVDIDSTGHLHIRFHAASGITGAPVVGGGRLWSLDTSAGVLHAMSETTGATAQSVAVGSVTRFATPAIYGRLVIVPTLAGITVVKTS